MAKASGSLGPPNEQGLQPNQFTQTTRGGKPADLSGQTPGGSIRDLPPVSEAHVQHMQSTRAAGEHAQKMEHLGWSGEGLSDAWRPRFSGLHSMMPNVSAEKGTSAINQPHEAEPSVPVMRRWEDMSAGEQGQGREMLRRQGFGGNGRDPMEHLVQNKTDQMYRHVARNNQAGVNESASQHFYGGAPVTTSIPDEHLQKTHTEAMNQGPGKLDEMRGEISNHPTFQGATRHLSAAQQDSASRAMAGKAIADTSPNLKYYQPLKSGDTKWPNIESAQKGARAALEGGEPESGGQGFMTSRKKARDSLQHMMTSGDYDAGNMAISPKTSPFGGALVQPHSADAFTVDDVHESNSQFPGGSGGTGRSRGGDGQGFTAAKSAVYRDDAGTRVEHFADEPAAKVEGMTRQTETKKTAKGPIQVGATATSRGEAMLNTGYEGVAHRANDYASRVSNAKLGISRSVNHADNVHPAQAARWGGEQMDRTDIMPAHAHMYPVIQNHGSDHPGGRLHTMHAAASGDEGAQRLVSEHQFGQIHGNGHMPNPHLAHKYDPSRDMSRGGYLS